MIGNYRGMSFGGCLLACGFIAGLVVFCLSDAKSDEAKTSDPQKPTVVTADSPATSGIDIKVGVQTKDGAPVLASEKYKNDLISAQFPASMGRKIMPDEAAKLEKKLEENPDDLHVASQLLGFYYNERFKKAPNPDASQKSEKLILSLIQSHPDAAILGTVYAQLSSGINCTEARELWAKQVENNSKSIPILMNAVGLLDRGLAEKYLLQAQALEPDNSIISGKLAGIYKSRRSFDKDADKSALAAKELTELTKVYKNTDNEAKKAMLLPQMAKAALEIPGDLDLADKQADLMISQAKTAQMNWPSGSGGGTVWSRGTNDEPMMIRPETEYLFYFGYFTKGMVALKNGDTGKAVEFLLKSVEDCRFDRGSLSTGPNMSLAKALLEAGKKDAVIEFLDKCGNSWKNDQGKIAKWTAEIKADKIPDFGPSLNY